MLAVKLGRGGSDGGWMGVRVGGGLGGFGWVSGGCARWACCCGGGGSCLGAS